jgi:hypothetical protein
MYDGNTTAVVCTVCNSKLLTTTTVCMWYLTLTTTTSGTSVHGTGYSTGYRVPRTTTPYL